MNFGEMSLTLDPVYLEKSEGFINMFCGREWFQFHLSQGLTDTNNSFQLKTKKEKNRIYW